VDHYLRHLEQASRSVTVEHLGLTLLANRRAMGGRGSKSGTLAEITERWTRFARSFPGRMTNEITSEEINDWLVALTGPAGETLSLSTRRGYRRVLHTVYAFAAAKVRRWVETNPVAGVELPTPAKHKVVLLAPEKVEQLLNAAVPQMRPYFALCAFAGLRPDHAKEIHWEQIHFDRGELGEIEVHAGTDKTDAERIVPIQPILVGQVAGLLPLNIFGAILKACVALKRNPCAS
jgi:integrase